MNSSSVGCNSGKLPKISIPGKKIKCGYGKKNFPHVWKCILSINSLKVTLCAIWIIHFVQTINHIKHIDLWNTQAPLISFYQHSPDHEISPHYSANMSFLLTFNFSPLYILPAYIQLLPLIYPSTNIHQTMRFLLITVQISKIFLGALPPNPPYLSFLLTFKGTGDFFSFQQKVSNYFWGFDPKPPYL